MTKAIEILKKELRFQVSMRNGLSLQAGIDWRDIDKMDRENREIALGITVLEAWEVKEEPKPTK